MKPRLYQRNVIEGEKKMAAFTADYGKNHRKRVFIFVGMIILACLFNVLLTWILSQYLNLVIPIVIFVPITVRLLLPHFHQLLMERQMLQLLQKNRNTYSEWMSFQETKITDHDCQSACQVFCQYQDTFREKHEELRAHLKEQLKQKSANQLIICVFAGLIFLSNDSADYKLLFDAKYKHGAVGNMIPDIWIKVLNPAEAEKCPKTHLECAGEFCAYWDRKSTSVKV